MFGLDIKTLSKDTSKYNILVSLIFIIFSFVLIFNNQRIVLFKTEIQQQVSFSLSIFLSLYRIILGASCAYFLGLLLSLSVFKYIPTRIKLFLMIIFLLLAITPPPIWSNLTISILRFSNAIPIVSTILSSIFILVVVNITSMEQIPKRYFHIYNLYRKSFKGEIKYVIFPSIAPSLIFTFRLCMLVSWIGLLTAESYGVNSGLGHMLLFGRQMYDWKLIISAWFAILSCAVFTDIIAIKFGRFLFNDNL